MPATVTCPLCGQLVDAQSRLCSNCGIDMALAAVIAERALTSSIAEPGAPITPEILVPRVGDYLLEKGILSPQDLQRALEVHAGYIRQGEPRLLGQVLLEMGLVDREALDQVITEQILKLQDALQRSNRHLEQRVQDRTRELQHALSKLTELNQLKTNFISNISHELRTPLTHIRGYLTLLADGSLGPLSDSQKEAFDVLVRAEARLEHLIDDLIQFSLATRGELSLSIAPANLKQLISNAVNRAARVATTRQITISVTCPENLPPVRCDGEKIAWVILQLLDNAIKFTPQGGNVQVQVIHESNLVTLSIIDTGIGISKERIEEIFEPFHQLDGSVTRRYSGVGLGLALVRRIVEAHGSSVKVKSELDKGSCFEFSLLVGS